MLSEYDFSPWLFLRNASEEERAAQTAWQQVITARGEVELAEDVFISPHASVFPDRLRMGRRSYIAAHAYVTDDVEFGEHCTLNPFAVARGRVRLGDGVRVGAHASLLGFNHGTDPDRPIREQPISTTGIAVGDDVWIGSAAVILDGVTIGAHSIIAAGAIVTKDVPQWTVIGGNPARPIRDRRQPRRADLGDRLAEFACRAREQIPDVLARSWIDETFLDKPGAAPTVRAWCDAVEIADIAGMTPPQVESDELVDRLRARQDAVTGLIPERGQDGISLDDGSAIYHILCVGYALQLLGATFQYPIQAVAELSSIELVERLNNLPWQRKAWHSGAWIDAVGTALYRNTADFGVGGELETLFGWLTTRCRRAHGMWGEPDGDVRWLQVVNGFYRLTRGTYAQFGVPLPYPERAIDTLLAHTNDTAYFRADRGTACNVLDMIHPLWLSGRQTGHRREEGEAWARRQLDRILRSWVDGAGFSFELETGSQQPGRIPGLQGTEMWLAITWLLADYLGRSDALGFRPRGIHRPEPGWPLTG